MEIADLRTDAMAAWNAGLHAVDAETCVRRALAARPDLDPNDPRTFVVAVGKAAAGMLRGLRPEGAAHPGISRAIVVLPDGVATTGLLTSVEIYRGGHPHPTREGYLATYRILQAARALRAEHRLFVLLSGGASALLESPAPGLDFEHLVAAGRALVTSGLPIASINLVRGCLSAVKAGGLALAAYPAPTTTFAISDVEGDDPAVIGSGPTAPAALPFGERCQRALEIAAEADVVLPRAALDFLRHGAEEASPQPRGKTDPSGAPSEYDAGDYTVVASIGEAIAAAKAELVERGYRIVSPRRGERLSGDSAGAGARIVAGAFEAETASHSGERCAAVFGGETTVAVPIGVAGRGGRNLDVAARVALGLRNRERVTVISAGTDGIDGSSRAAGAIVDGATTRRCDEAGRPLRAALDAFDTEPALEAAGDLVVTGPTGTNVGDLVVIVAAAG